MNLQYISDAFGKTTAVIIPISDWDKLKVKYSVIEQDELPVPQWHKDVVRERIETYVKNPSKVLDFNSAFDDIEKDL